MDRQELNHTLVAYTGRYSMDQMKSFHLNGYIPEEVFEIYCDMWALHRTFAHEWEWAGALHRLAPHFDLPVVQRMVRSVAEWRDLRKAGLVIDDDTVTLYQQKPFDFLAIVPELEY